MKQGFLDYISDYRNLSSECKKYLNLFMLQALTSGVGFYIAVFLKVHLDFSPKVIGYIVGFYVAGNFFGSWFTSKVLDKFNPFRYSSLMLIIQGLAFLAVCLSSGVTLISAIMFILGLSNYAYTVATNYIVTVLAGKDEEKRSTAISFLNVFSNVGMGLGGVIVSFCSKNHPVEMLFSMGIILITSALFYLKSDTIGNRVRIINNDKDLRPNYIIYRLSLFIIFCLGLIFAQQRVSYSLFLEDSFGKGGASSIFLLNSLLLIFLLPSVIKFSKRFNKLLVLGFGGLFLGGSMFFLQYAHAFYIAVTICIVATIGEMLGAVFSHLMCFQSSPAHKQGQAMGYYKLLYAFGTWVGSNIGGNIQDIYGLKGVWEFCGIVGFLIFTSCFILFRTRLKHQLA